MAYFHFILTPETAGILRYLADHKRLTDPEVLGVLDRWEHAEAKRLRQFPALLHHEAEFLERYERRAALAQSGKEVCR